MWYQSSTNWEQTLLEQGAIQIIE
uniref:Uncharacterized protein n=1 Tax=Arundo donax TaxID=35708 RepID=A0A0A8Z0Z8_ARUDO